MLDIYLRIANISKNPIYVVKYSRYTVRCLFLYSRSIRTNTYIIRKETY